MCLFKLKIIIYHMQNVCKNATFKISVKISKAGKLDFPAFAGTPGGI